MGKTETFQDLALAAPEGEYDLWRWLYTELRAAILDGRLKQGGRMPSTRSLAAQYGVSRGTVVAAFRQLQAEGYTETRVSSGTFVVSNLPDQALPAKDDRQAARLPASRATLSRRAQETLKDVVVLPSQHSIGKAFRTYEPAIDLFPVELWARVASRVLRHAPRSLYGQGNAGGYPPLRRAIAEYVGGSRGVHCSPEQIIVTSGAQQALDLLARFLLDPGDEVWIEDPGYPGARQTLRAAGAKVIPVPVDAEGLEVKAGRRVSPRARLAYVTPANQFPLGVAMSANRRMELLKWALESGAWVVEDEYDAEYRYFGRPVAALQSLDRSDSVIYVGTFTKMLFNALRLGFMVLPKRLIGAFEAGRSFVDRHPPTLDQAILAEFITEGYFGHHVRRMRQTYRERMSVLKEAAAEHLSGLLEVTNAAAGMRTVGWLRVEGADKAAAARAQGLGLEAVPLSIFTQTYEQKPGLILGFAGCKPNELRRGAAVLAAALRSM
ncbi:MAG TPA: PLP-dependent aminotransferase family protein [Bryobacteraceae bacterium]|nr:PLP-dependent aminotransferase family protein [Bryobacteraceae bacterium]